MQNPTSPITILTSTVTALLFVCLMSPAIVEANQVIDAARILSLMREAMPHPPAVTFSQDVNVTGILGRWHFKAAVKRQGEAVSVKASGAPGFIPPALLADLADFEKALAGFILEYSGQEKVDGRSCHVLKGIRRPQLYAGALEGRIWIDEKEHLMRKTEARYSWGTVRVNHSYTRLGDYTVLSRQEASITPFATRLTVIYGDYRLND